MPITVNRGGITSKQWYQTGISVNPEQNGGALLLRFNLDSKGGGKTDILVNIDPDSFGKMIALMLKCSFDITIKAFAKEIIRLNRSKKNL